MGLLRGLAVGVGTLGLIAVSAAPAAADSVTVNSVAVLTSYGPDTETFTTVGTPWTLGSTQLTFLTTSCGEEHCESTGTFSADNGQGSGVTGTFSSSVVVDSTLSPLFRSDLEVAFTVTGGFGTYTGAAGSGQLSAKGACYSIVCIGLVGTQQFQFTTPPPPPPSGPPSGKSHGNNGHHNGRGHSGK